jgi:hypothetical protein
MAGRAGAKARARSLNWFPNEAGNQGPFFWVEFDGSSSMIDCGHDGSLANIWMNEAVTVEAWAYFEPFVGQPSMYQALLSKAAAQGGGYWTFRCTYEPEGTYLDCVFTPDYIPVISRVAVGPEFFSLWHHLLAVYDDTGGPGTPIYLAIDGVWAAVYVVQDPRVEAWVNDDTSGDLVVGRDSIGDMDHLDGGIQWVRISNSIRHTIGLNFTPPDMCAPPVPDPDTKELWAVDEGIGVVTAATVHTPGNDGAMTNCPWYPCEEE